jgi:hypothetical protein
MEKIFLLSTIALVLTACDPTPHHKTDRNKIDALTKEIIK